MMDDSDENTPFLAPDKDGAEKIFEPDTDVKEHEDETPAKKPVLESHSCEQYLLADALKDVENQRKLLEVNKDGETVFHVACMEGQTQTVRAIADQLDEETLEKLVFLQDNDKHTTLHCACMMGEIDIVTLLAVLLPEEAFHRLVFMKDTYNRTALHLACMMGKPDAFKVISDHLSSEAFEQVVMVIDTDYQSVLHYACSRDMIEVVTYVTEHTSKEGFQELAFSQDKHKATILHLACEYGPTEIVRAIFDKVPYELSQKLALVTDNKDMTGLHLACISGLTDTVKLLLERFKVNIVQELLLAKDQKGKTATQYTSEYRQYEALTAIMYCRHSFSEKVMTSVPKDIILQACERGAKSSVLAILKAAERANREATLLQDFLQAEDVDGRTILHIACSRADVELVRGIIKCMQKLNKVWMTDVICHCDKVGRNALHEGCQQGDNHIVRMLLDIAGRIQCVPRLVCKQDDNKWTPLFEAFEHRSVNNVRSIIDQAAIEESTCVTELLSCKNKDEQTIFHRACQGQHVGIRCTEAVLNVAKKCGILIDQLRMKDSSGKTFLSYVGEAKPLVVQLLIKSVTAHELESLENPKNAEFQEHVYYFLTSTDKNNKNAMWYAQKSQTAKELTPFLSPFMTDKMTDASPSDFHLIHQVNIMADYDQNYSTNLLVHMGRSQCLDLINHEYIQRYLRLCWERSGRYFFRTSLALYAMLLLALTTFTMCHQYNPLLADDNTSPGPGNSSTSSEESNGVFTLLNGTTVFQYILIVFTVLTVVSEVMQMIAKGKYYWKNADNYIDIAVCLGSLLVSIAPLCSPYDTWHHQVATVTMFVAWVNAAWMMTKISFGKLQTTSLRFIMLFRVIKAVCVFFPIFAVFILTFTLAFSSLFNGHPSFQRFGFSILKIMVMTTGEFEFESIFSQEDDIHNSPFYILGCILFVVFLGVMTISAMNLLVGVAVGDINELSTHSEVLAFKSQVELVIESQAMVALVTKFKNTIRKGK